jgi:hypothetical protein
MPPSTHTGCRVKGEPLRRLFARPRQRLTPGDSAANRRGARSPMRRRPARPDRYRDRRRREYRQARGESARSGLCSSSGCTSALEPQLRAEATLLNFPRLAGRKPAVIVLGSVSQSVGSLLRSSTGTRKNSSRAPLSSTRVSCCVFGRRRSSDGSRPVRRRTSFTAMSLKPGFLCQGTPLGGYGTGRHLPLTAAVIDTADRRTCSAVSSTNTNPRRETEPDRVFRTATGGEKSDAPGSITAPPPGAEIGSAE